MSSSNDPRVYFAAERTLLAWLRTGIAVMGVGFLVARFGLLLRTLRHEDAAPHPMSTLLGVGFVLLGAIGIAGAGLQFLQFLRTLGPNDRPPGYWLGMSLWYTGLMALLGLVLAAWLAWGLAPG